MDSHQGKSLLRCPLFLSPVWEVTLVNQCQTNSPFLRCSSFLLRMSFLQLPGSQCTVGGDDVIVPLAKQRYRSLLLTPAQEMETQARPSSFAYYPCFWITCWVLFCWKLTPSSELCKWVPREVLFIFLCDIPRCLQVSQVISKFLPKKKKRLIFIDFLSVYFGGGVKSNHERKPVV